MRGCIFARLRKRSIGLGTRVATQLASVPGAEHIRQSLLRDNLAYYQQFVAQATGDHELQAELAMTHSRIGALVKELESAERSFPHYEKSAEIYRQLADQSPESSAIVQAAAQNINQLGLCCLLPGGRPMRERRTTVRSISSSNSFGGMVSMNTKPTCADEK